MNSKQLLINKLTKKRKRLEKRIAKLDRKSSILEWLLSRCSFNKTTNGITLAGFIGFGCMLLSALLIVCGFASTFLAYLSVVPLLCLPGIECGLEAFVYPFLKEHFDFKSVDLESMKKEVLTQIDCARREVEYVKPVKEEKVSTSTSHDNMLIILQERKAKEREEALSKAKSVGIDVDRIEMGPTAYSSKKEYREAKQDLDNFFEENNISL